MPPSKAWAKQLNAPKQLAKDDDAKKALDQKIRALRDKYVEGAHKGRNSELRRLANGH
jgi:hypothetical protein